MSVLREIIEVSRELEDSFDAVADFSNAVMWDPGVIAAEQTREGEASPSGVGAEYQLTVTFRGRESVMTYRTMEYRRPSRIVLEGSVPGSRPATRSSSSRCKAAARTSPMSPIFGSLVSRSWRSPSSEALSTRWARGPSRG